MICSCGYLCGCRLVVSFGSVPQPRTNAEAAIEFFAMESFDDSLHWRLPVTLGLCGATGTLHGGCALAAVVAALETVTDRSLASATSQYLSRVVLGETAEVNLEILASGRRMTQAAATITHEDRLICRMQVALGGRDLGIDRSWLEAPSVPPPDQCEERAKTASTETSFTDNADVRLAGQQAGDRRVRYWARLPGHLASTAPGLAALADLVPSGMRVSLNSGFRGSSLDNTVRMAGLDESEWVLLDIETVAIHDSIGHGTVRIFGEGGQLLASGSQCFAISQLTGPLDR